MCRGVDNKVPSAALTACRPRLIAELKEANPDLVLALGGSALAALTEDHKIKITQQRGSLGGIRIIEGLQVWPTIHPASLLYNDKAFPDFAADLEALPDLLSGKKKRVKIAEGNFREDMVDDREKFIHFIQLLEDLPPDTKISCDSETSGFDYTREDLLCLSLSKDDGRAWIITEEMCLELDLMRRLFDLDHLQWVYHNSKFDAQFIRARLAKRIPVNNDTMMMSYALDERSGVHSLKHLSRKHEDASDYEKMATQFIKKKTDSYRVIPKDILHKYAGYDAIYTRRLQDTLWEQMTPELRNFYTKVLMPATNWFLNVELNGMLVDRSRLDATSDSLIGDITAVEEEMFAMTGNEFNPRAPGQVAHEMYDKLGLRTLRKYGRSTNAAALEVIAHPFARKMEKHRELSKLFSTYVKGLDAHVWPDGRVHPQYLVHGAVSRTSCKFPNIQNIPRGPVIRSLFVAPEGYDFVPIDYSQHEFRMMAVFSKDPWLTEVFNAGRSLHKEAAIAKFGPGYTHEQYIRIKARNFGVAYGRKEFSLAAEFNISIDQARQEIMDFYEQMPLVARWMQVEKEQVLTEGWQQTPLGRMRRYGLITVNNREEVLKQAINFKPQATGSDTALMGGCAVDNSGLFAPDEVLPVGFVHDSVLFYIKSDIRDQVVPEICKIMARVPQEALKTDVQFAVEAKAGRSWGDTEEA